MATHSSILAWKIPWAEEPGGLQSIGPQRVWPSDLAHTCTQYYIISWWEGQMQGNQYMEIETRSQMITKYDILFSVPHSLSRHLQAFPIFINSTVLPSHLLTSDIWHHLLPRKPNLRKVTSPVIIQKFKKEDNVSEKQYMYMYMLSRVWLFATLWTVAYQAPLSLRFPRQEYWSGLPIFFSKIITEVSLYVVLDEKAVFFVRKKKAYFIWLLYIHQRLDNMIYLTHAGVHTIYVKEKNKTFNLGTYFSKFLSFFGQFCQGCLFKWNLIDLNGNQS